MADDLSDPGLELRVAFAVDDELTRRGFGPPPRHPGAAEGAGLRTGSDVELARVLKQRLDARDGPIVFAEGSLYRHDQTHWSPYERDELRREVHCFNGLRPLSGPLVRLNSSRVDSVLRELGAMASEPDFFVSARLGINCASGFIEFDAEGRPALSPHDRAHRVRHVLPGQWDQVCDWSRAPLLNALLGGCFRDDADKAERVDLIGEVFGAAALAYGTKLRQPLAFVFCGASANNGKSQMLDCGRGLLPPSATASIPPAKFGDEKMLASLAGVNLNTSGELGAQHAIASDVFKSVVTGDPMTGRHPYDRPFEFRPQALHAFATNSLPAFRGGLDHGVRRRVRVLTFNRSIPRDEMIPDLAVRIIREEFGALLAYAVEGAGRLIRHGAFTEPRSCREALNEWVTAVDPVTAWYAERAVYQAGHRVSVRACFDDFRTWARGEGLPADVFVHIFVRRVLNHDNRLRAHKSNALRSIVGLRLRPH